MLLLRISRIRGVGIFVSRRLQAHQVIFNSPDFEDYVWAKIQLRGCDSLLVGCIYRSPTGHLNTSVSSLYNLFAKLDNYSHLLICGDFNFKDVAWSDFSGSATNSHIVHFLTL